MYLALYARRAWVIFDHPYNADSGRMARQLVNRPPVTISAAFGHLERPRVDWLLFVLTRRRLSVRLAPCRCYRAPYAGKPGRHFAAARHIPSGAGYVCASRAAGERAGRSGRDRWRGAPGDADDALDAGVHQALVRAVCAHDEQFLAAQVRVPPVAGERDLASVRREGGPEVVGRPRRGGKPGDCGSVGPHDLDAGLRPAAIVGERDVAAVR